MGAKSAMRRGPSPSSLVTFLLVVAGAYVGYALCWQTPPPPPALDYADRVAAYCSAPVDAGDEGGEGLVAATVVVRHGARSAIHDPPGTGRADVFDCSLPARVAAVASRWPRAKRFRAATRGWHRCAEGQLVARGYDAATLSRAMRDKYGQAPDLLPTAAPGRGGVFGWHWITWCVVLTFVAVASAALLREQRALRKFEF